MSDRTLISSSSAFEAQIGYSRAVVSGDWVFVSGCTGYDYATGELRSGVVAQADQALQNVAAALARVAPDDAHGAVSVADVVRVRYILPDRALFPSTWPVLQRYFGGEGGARPAATMIQAGLIEEAVLFEVEVTARRPRKADEAGAVQSAPDL